MRQPVSRFLVLCLLRMVEKLVFTKSSWTGGKFATNSALVPRNGALQIPVEGSQHRRLFDVLDSKAQGVSQKDMMLVKFFNFDYSVPCFL